MGSVHDGRRGAHREVGRTGARFSPRAAADTGPATADPDADGAEFATAVRGYDRSNVDRFVAGQRRVQGELRAALAAAEARVRELTGQVHAATRENERLHAEGARGPAGPAEGYGTRAEKLLRLAEREAAEIRTAASRESAARSSGSGRPRKSTGTCRSRR